VNVARPYKVKSHYNINKPFVLSAPPFVRPRKDENIKFAGDGARAQGKTRAGPAAYQTRAKDPTIRAADPTTAQAHGHVASGLRAAYRRAEGGSRARRKDQLHGTGVARVGAAADDLEGGAIPSRGLGWHCDP
jgi:hypothetical protein